MKEVKDIKWFEKEMSPLLKGYELSYRFFEQGDFGSLNQVEFNSESIGGNVDFWSKGWLGVFVWDYVAEKEMLNVLVNPDQEKEKEELFEKLKKLVKWVNNDS